MNRKRAQLCFLLFVTFVEIFSIYTTLHVAWVCGNDVCSRKIPCFVEPVRRPDEIRVHFIDCDCNNLCQLKDPREPGRRVIGRTHCYTMDCANPFHKECNYLDYIGGMTLVVLFLLLPVVLIATQFQVFFCPDQCRHKKKRNMNCFKGNRCCRYGESDYRSYSTSSWGMDETDMP